MLCPQGQDPSISGRWSSNSQIRTKESHYEYGNSQIRDLPENNDPRWSDPSPES